MKRIIPVTLCAMVIIALTLLPVLPVSAADMAGKVDLSAAKATFERTCNKCHSLSRPLGKKKDKAGWETTVKRMSGYHASRFGAPIPEADQNAIVQYLLNVAGK